MAIDDKLKEQESIEQQSLEQESQASAKTWYLYMIRCKDNSLYTGITLDVQRRFQEHQGGNGLGKGAKFLRGKGPLALVYSTSVATHSAALKLEYKIKKMSKAKKEIMIIKNVETQRAAQH